VPYCPYHPKHQYPSYGYCTRCPRKVAPLRPVKADSYDNPPMPAGGYRAAVTPPPPRAYPEYDVDASMERSRSDQGPGPAGGGYTEAPTYGTPYQPPAQSTLAPARPFPPAPRRDPVTYTRDPRYPYLSKDPDHGKATEGSHREARSALGMEYSGQVPGPVSRGGAGGGDFRDGAGTDYDLKSPRSDYFLPGPSNPGRKKKKGGFNPAPYVKQLREYASRGIVMVIDRSSLTREDELDLESAFNVSAPGGARWTYRGVNADPARYPVVDGPFAASSSSSSAPASRGEKCGYCARRIPEERHAAACKRPHICRWCHSQIPTELHLRSCDRDEWP
jgi:hypothetical protein